MDIGCGYGDFLASFSEDAWVRQGLELNQDRADFARKEFSLSIEESTLQNRCFNSESIDLLCAFGVIEHFLDIRGFLEETFRVMKKGAIGCFSVADLSNPLSGLSDYFSIEHILYFSPHTLKILLEATGFEILHSGGLTPPNYYDTACIFRRPVTPGTDGFLNRQQLLPQIEEVHTIEAAVTEYIRGRELLTQNVRQRLINFGTTGNLNNLAIYCTGEHTKHLLKVIPELQNVQYFFDSDQRKWGTTYARGKIYSVLQATDLGIDKIIISSRAFQEEITEHLRQILPDKIEIINIY